MLFYYSPVYMVEPFNSSRVNSKLGRKCRQKRSVPYMVEPFSSSNVNSKLGRKCRKKMLEGGEGILHQGGVGLLPALRNSVFPAFSSLTHLR